jgi:small subunit ribosomal protein S1
MSIRKQERDNVHRTDGNLDPELQRELDEALGDMSIEDMLDVADGAARGRGAKADGVRTGKVIDIQRDDIFVDFGGKSQGVLQAVQFGDDPLPKVGDMIEVTVERYDPSEGLLILSREGAVVAATWSSIKPGQVVEAFVTGANTGGLELKFNGIRGFMPMSMIDLARTEDTSPYMQTKMMCEIVDIDRQRKSVTLSRRKLLEAQAAENREKILAELAEGKIIPGTVRSIMPYGAFVDLGGVDGLLHVSDMSYSRVEKPEEIVKVGQKVEVMILKLDRAADRISLGLKQVQPDPWTSAAAKWPADEVVTGRVTRLADFGAFVELEPGVEGLVPISEMSFEKRIKHPGEIISVGDTPQLRVLSVDPQRKRISLSIKRVGDDPWVGASVRWPAGTVVEGVVKRLESFGAFVELAPGVEALVHVSEASENRVRHVSEVLKEGQLIQAKVQSVDEQQRRISLSIKALRTDPNFTGAGIEENPQAQAETPKPEKKRKTPLRGGLDGPDWSKFLK